MKVSTTQMPQNTTESHSPQQLRAVELLLGGLTVTAVAAELGVGRETVRRWLRRDWYFVAAMNRAKRELNEAAKTRLLTVWGKAAENVAKAVEGGDLRASLLVLKGFSEMVGQAPRVGSDDPQKLEENAKLAHMEAENADYQRRMMAAIGR